MDDARVGDALRLVRVRARLRQEDVARRARVSRQLVSRLERGRAGGYSLETLRAVATVLGVSVDVRLRWQGAELDRVLSSAHATMHESVARALAALPGWACLPEVTFAHYGERGVIDIVAWHTATRSLLIIELKTELVDPQGLVATMHRRVRLGHRIAAAHGWEPSTVSAWVIVRDTSTERRRLARHVRLLRAAFPADGRTVRGWLARPQGRIAALSFLSDVAPGGVSQVHGRVGRVRRPSAARSVRMPERAIVPRHERHRPDGRATAG